MNGSGVAVGHPSTRCATNQTSPTYSNVHCAKQTGDGASRRTCTRVRRSADRQARSPRRGRLGACPVAALGPVRHPFGHDVVGMKRAQHHPGGRGGVRFGGGGGGAGGVSPSKMLWATFALAGVHVPVRVADVVVPNHWIDTNIAGLHGGIARAPTTWTGRVVRRTSWPTAQRYRTAREGLGVAHGQARTGHRNAQRHQCSGGEPFQRAVLHVVLPICPIAVAPVSRGIAVWRLHAAGSLADSWKIKRRPTRGLRHSTCPFRRQPASPSPVKDEVAAASRSVDRRCVPSSRSTRNLKHSQAVAERELGTWHPTLEPCQRHRLETIGAARPVFRIGAAQIESVVNCGDL